MGVCTSAHTRFTATASANELTPGMGEFWLLLVKSISLRGDPTGVEPRMTLSRKSKVPRIRISSDTLKVGSRRKRMLAVLWEPLASGFATKRGKSE